MAKNNKMNSAKKAAITRSIRKAFENKYSTWTIARDLLQGYSTKKTAKMNSTTIGTVAACLANLHRDCDYADMARACNY